MSEDELQIDYPCRWQFKIIGADEEELRAAAASAVEATGKTEYELTFSKRSAKGRYLSLTLELELRDEAHRKGIWDRLVANAAVKYLF